MLTGAQIRSARHAVKMSVDALAEKSDVSSRTIKRMEANDGITGSTAANISAVKAALETAGIEFIGTHDDGPGIRLWPRV